MGMFYVLLLVCVLSYLLYRYLTKNYNYWKDKKVFHITPKILLGNYADFFFQRKTVGQINREFYNKFPDARFIGIYKFRTPELIITEPEDIKRVLVADFNYFQDRSLFTNESTEPLTVNLFNVRSDKWRPMRQKVTPAFTTGKLRNMIPLILEVSKEFTNYLQNVVEQENETECRELMAKFTTDVIGSIGFGVQMNSMLDVDAPFRKIGRKIFEINNVRLFILRSIFRSVFNFFNIRVSSKEVEDFFMGVVKEIVEDRERKGIVRHDFIDLMLELKKKEKISSDTNPEIKVDLNFILAQTFIFFAAGFETSSTLMSFVLHELALHQDIQDKVYEEIMEMLNNCDEKLSYETISEMHYLEMVICETQRKYPALGNLTRICTNSYTFPDSKTTLDKGVFISIPVLALHYDPKYYPDPEKFIPERFSPEAKKNIHPMVFLPFGEGPRNCVGLRLGKMQSIIGLITLLKDYRVEPCKKTKPKIELQPLSFVTANKDGIWLSIKKRV